MDGNHTEAQYIIKKGKKQAAFFIQKFCINHSHLDVTNEVFDSILNPVIPIDDWDAIDWCRWLLAGGKTPEEFAQTVRKYDNATTCGLVWTANFVAYRCRTCGISPCMSLCSDCFQRGNHEGHDFNMFRSQAGGACDCGDKSVMRESGFCQRHGPQNQINKPEAPSELLCVAEALMPRLFLRLIQHLRDNSEPSSHLRDNSEPVNMARYSVMPMADSLLSLLHNHCEMGAAMRKVMTHALINSKLYFQLAVDLDTSIPGLPGYNIQNLNKYLEARNGFENSDDDLNIAARCSTPSASDIDLLKQSSFLDELVFWTVKFEFPQKLVCLLLNMMPDLDYKVAFTKIFVRHYDRISKMLAKSSDSDTLSNRVVHVSVQLFSNEDLAYQMTKDYDLLRIMIKSLHSMMEKIAQNSVLQCIITNEHRVVDCSHRIMKEHCYWPLVSDLNNVLTHEAVAFEFLSDVSLLKLWFKFLSLFQGMNVNEREMKDHVEFESNTYFAAFAAELEASATPMWALISHLKSPETLNKTKEILKICKEALLDWFDTIGFNLDEAINPYQISFHIPLHRCYASFLGQAIRQQGATLDHVLPSEDDLKLMMMHPMQAQVAFHEILCNLWVRSGLQIKGQAMTYIQCHFCNSIVDADLFLLQLCAMKLDPDWFIKTVFEKFHVWEWFTFHPKRVSSYMEYDKLLPMLEGALSFLCTLLSIHTNIGQTEEEVTRQEMVSLLCMSDRTHSQLLDLLPDKCGAISQNKDFENILEKVADYKAPNFEAGGTMLQGTFIPRGHIWEEEYDPIHVLLRAVHRREYQSSLDRYAQYLRQSNKFSSSRPPWPPYRIPGPVHKEFIDPRRILHSKILHGLIFIILHRAMNEPDIPEQILSLCIYLLDMAIKFPYTGESSEPTTEQKEKETVEDMVYTEWFDSFDTRQNISKVIPRLIVTEKIVMSMSLVEAMEVDEDVEEDIEMGTEAFETQNPIVEEEFQDNVLSLPPSEFQLALPSSTSNTVGNDLQLVSVFQATGAELVPFQPTPSTSAACSRTSSSSTSNNSSGCSHSNSYNMALIPTSEGLATVRPRCLKLKQVPGCHRVMLSDKGLPLELIPEATSVDRKYMAFSSKRTLSINESILSLLIQLHSKLSEKPNSYQPKSRTGIVYEESRIGDGVLFIERLLDYIASLGYEKVREIQSIRERLWPKKDDTSGSPSMENIDKEERRRRAKERQQKLMAEFASKQRAFMQKTLEAENAEGATGVDESLLNKEKEYECVICGQMTASEEDRPVGMVVLLQATSVIGHSHQYADRKLPCNDDERLELQKGMNLSAAEENRVEFLTQEFDNRQWPMAVNIGWQGGVLVQSCGHYLHIDCHKSYVQSLKSQNQVSSRLQNLDVDNGEYSCPLCRQLANSVIPLNPSYGKNSALVHSHTQHWEDVALDLSEMIATTLSERESNLLKKYMGVIMEDITNATFPQYRSLCAPNSSSLFLFVCSISRTNLEVELVQRGGNLLKPMKKKSCFVPLMHVLSMHSRLLLPMALVPTDSIASNSMNQYRELGRVRGSSKSNPSVLPSVPNQVWTRLTGILPTHEYSLAVQNAEVPLLLRDCIALLLQIALTLPLNIDKVYYTCVVQVLYNLLYIQGVVQISYFMKSADRTVWKDIAQKRPGFQNSENQEEMNDLAILLYHVIKNFQGSCLYVEDDEMCEPCPVEKWDDNSLEQFMVDHCIHYLRIASLLQSHLYEEDIPQIKDGESEFSHLCHYLGLTTVSSAQLRTSSCVRWIIPDAKFLINLWCKDLMPLVKKSVITARGLVVNHNKWNTPALLKLPYNYDDIFKYYHKRKCSVCHSDPKDPSLCLVCGTLVCLRESCCRQSPVGSPFEAVAHSISCGAGTAIYLAVNSSTIIVIRGKRACLWGSVYLDSFGEEDRDLKRGKPLYLSDARYNLLQQQWINHSFDHTNKRWVWHKDNL